MADTPELPVPDWLDRLDVTLQDRCARLPVERDGPVATASRYAIKRHILIPGFAIAWGAGVLTGRPRLRNAGAAGTLGLIATAMASRSIKAQIRRRRPDERQRQTDERQQRHIGRPVSARSFPSGHAGSAFAAATAVAVALGGPAEAALVLAGAGILASGRVVRGRHWPSDVVAGAVLGSTVTLLASWLVRGVGRRL